MFLLSSSGALHSAIPLPLVCVAISVMHYQCRFYSSQGVRIRPCAKGTNSPSAAPSRDGGETRGRCAAMEKQNAKYFHCGSLKTSSFWPVRLHHIRCDKNDTSSCWPLRLNDIQSGCLKTLASGPCGSTISITEAIRLPNCSRFYL